MCMKRVVRIPMRTDVIELLDGDRPVVLDRARNRLEVRNDAIVARPKIAACQDRGLMNGHGFDNNHAGPANRSFGIVGNVPFGRHAIFGHVGGVSSEHDPVSQGATAQLYG